MDENIYKKMYEYRKSTIEANSSDLKNLNNAKQLSNLFKEIQDIRYGKVQVQKNEFDKKKEKIKNQIVPIDKKFCMAGAAIGGLFLILFATSVQCNYKFATAEPKRVAIGDFEENEDKIDIMGTISANISELTKKEIITKQIEIPYQTKYIDNAKLPKGEEKTIQAGRFGYKEQTIIRTYENDEMVNENIINELDLSNPIDYVVEVGTSEFLFNKKVHIGEKMFTVADTAIYKYPEAASEVLGTVYESIDVVLLGESDGWTNIKVDGMEGYMKGEYLTSENLNPGITEVARKKRLKLSLNFDMQLNKPSGLTRADFVKVLSSNPRDIYSIFSDNAGLFYDIEQKYNVNGIFLASIGIHESGWGTSNIAKNKKNLFGYGSYDSSAYTSSYTFESYQYGIELVAKVLSKYYLNEPGTVIYGDETAAGSYYNGPTVAGVNTRYASDPNWATKVYETMVSLYESL